MRGGRRGEDGFPSRMSACLRSGQRRRCGHDPDLIRDVAEERQNLDVWDGQLSVRRVGMGSLDCEARAEYGIGTDAPLLAQLRSLPTTLVASSPPRRPSGSSPREACVAPACPTGPWVGSRGEFVSAGSSETCPGVHRRLSPNTARMQTSGSLGTGMMEGECRVGGSRMGDGGDPSLARDIRCRATRGRGYCR